MAGKGTCKSAGCEKGVQAKGYCPRHYAQWRKGKLPKPRYKICNTENCRKRQMRRGLCEDHFTKEFKKAPPAPVEAAAPPTPEA